MSKKTGRRTERLPITNPPLLAQSVSAGPSALQIAADTIERLTAENERLKDAKSQGFDLKVETVLYEALQFEREKVKALRRQIDSNELAWKKFRANRLLHAVGENLKPNDGSKEKP
jgi:hypothetical protein